jgi:hypothetical protein
VSVGSLGRWEVELESTKAHGTGMRFVEVEVPAISTAERPKLAAVGVIVAGLVLPGRARVRLFSREGTC